MIRINISIEGIGAAKTVLKRGTYPNERLALRLIDADDGSAFATLTVNLPEYDHLLKEGEFFIKTWAENASLIKALRVKNTVFLDTERKVVIGAGVVAEIWQFVDPKILDQIPIL